MLIYYEILKLQQKESNPEEIIKAYRLAMIENANAIKAIENIASTEERQALNEKAIESRLKIIKAFMILYDSQQKAYYDFSTSRPIIYGQPKPIPDHSALAIPNASYSEPNFNFAAVVCCNDSDYQLFVNDRGMQNIYTFEQDGLSYRLNLRMYIFGEDDDLKKLTDNKLICLVFLDFSQKEQYQQYRKLLNNLTHIKHQNPNLAITVLGFKNNFDQNFELTSEQKEAFFYQELEGDKRDAISLSFKELAYNTYIKIQQPEFIEQKSSTAPAVEGSSSSTTTTSTSGTLHHPISAAAASSSGTAIGTTSKGKKIGKILHRFFFKEKCNPEGDNFVDDSDINSDDFAGDPTGKEKLLGRRNTNP